MPPPRPIRRPPRVSRKKIKGTVIYLMGASGVGKDSLIDEARRSGLAGLTVAPRLVTREGGLKSNDLHLSEPQFDDLLDRGRLALHWTSHGHRYGIDRAIDSQLERGLAVIINGSRAYLDEARGLYPDLCPVLVTASPDILKSRLLRRGREDPSSIDERLSRTDESFNLPREGMAVIDNSGSLSSASERFIGLIKTILPTG